MKKVTVRWLGTAGLEIEHDGKTLLVDPYVSRVGKFALVAAQTLSPDMDKVRAYLAAQGSSVEGVIVSHTHFDHAMDVPAIVEETGAAVVGSGSLATLMRAHGLAGHVSVCYGGERVAFPSGARVTMYPSHHGLVAFGRVPYPGEIDPTEPLPFKASDYRVGSVFAPLIEVGGVRVLHLGSANFDEEALRGVGCHVLFVCVPGWRRLPHFVERLLSAVSAEVIIPFHYDDFTRPWDSTRGVPDLPLQGIPEFVQELERHAHGARILMPRPLEPVRLV